MSQDLTRLVSYHSSNIPCKDMQSTQICTHYISLHHKKKHRHCISSHVIPSDYHIVIVIIIVFHSTSITGTTGTTACPRWPCRSSPGPRPLRPRSVAAWSPRGPSLCTSMCTSKHGAAEIQNTKHVTSPKAQQIPTDPTGFDQI